MAILASACGAGSITGDVDLGGPPDAAPGAHADAAPPPPDAQLEMPTAETGGTLALAGCGYSVRTRSGATAPWLPPAGTALGPAPAPQKIHLGIAGDPRSTMAIVWRTGDSATLGTAVRYGVDSVDEARQDGFTFVYRSGSASDSPRLRIHETHLCGLRADTAYRYQVGTDGAWSAEHSFRTAPDLAADPSAQVTIAVLGDSRGGQAAWGSLIAAAQATAAPDVLFFTGDAVTSGTGQAEWDAFFDDGAATLAGVPLVTALGNHEANAINYFAQLALPGNEEWFGLDYGPVHLTVLNDSPSDPATIAGVQRTFLDDDLSASAAAPWSMLMHHRAMYSSSPAHGSNTTLRATWGPLVDQHAVDLVFAGHDHDYERTLPLRAGQVVAAGAGTVYIVSGGAGAELYSAGHESWTAVSESRRHYLVLTARAGRLDARTYRDDGSLLDSFSLAK